MATRIFIDGAAGTTGLEIRDRLTDRNEFELMVLDDAQRKDEAARKEALHEADIAILCLPDEAAREAVKLAEGSDTRIIDASSAHRVADGWTYGFMEIRSAHEIANAQYVSNPGCYPTGFLALMEPLICRNDCLPHDWQYTVNAVSGYSGGGNQLIKRFETDPDIAFRKYGLTGAHKHLLEMQHYAHLKYPPIFSPSVVPAFRGMLVEIALDLSVMDNAGPPRWIWELISEYADLGCDLIQLHDPLSNPAELVLRSDAEPWDGIDLFMFVDPDEFDSRKARSIRLIARLDNLGKGASGAAIQNLNIMCGLPHTTGLRL